MVPNSLLNFGGLSKNFFVPVSRLVRLFILKLMAIIQVLVWLHLRFFVVGALDLPYVCLKLARLL
ncbi:hypothetical protein MTR67_047960 [Solanum verrucosum]|uniref:Uncharacterized protein n=1 Tax=Solanum verrucosum TaxID=315347 RepID=A0AAF0ZZ38_SOLVR|nr:hypothetical protein MTR67_047960 [Solanum verrucosum]